MKTEFITTNSKLTVRSKWISEKPVIEKPESYWFHSFAMLALLLVYSFDEMLHERPDKLIAVILSAIWIAPHFVRIYQFLFINVWRSNIPVNEVKSIRLDDQFNELEDQVILTLHSGRKKRYLFRKREGQAAGFVTVVGENIKMNGMLLQ